MKSLLTSFSALMLAGGCASGAASRAAKPVTGNVAENNAQAQTDTDRAFALIQDGHFDRAQPLLQRAVVADPMYGPAHNDLGMVYYHAHQPYAAALEYRSAVKLMPRQPQPLNNLGLVLESAGKFREAEQSYHQAAALDPDNTEYAGNLARTRIRLGERDQTTTELLVKVILHDPRPAWVKWARSVLAEQVKPTTEPGSPR